MNTQAIEDVLAERKRQIEVEGFTHARDDGYANCELALAGAAYATAAALPVESRKWISGNYSIENNRRIYELWPWITSWWKPTTPRRDLVKAAALIIAEIERLDRRTPAPSSDGGV